MDKSFEKIISPIIKKAGEIMLSAKQIAVSAVKTGNFNFVTEYDVKVQNYLISELSKNFPTAVFFAEEKENDESLLSNDYCFIIDPIDGTTNLIRGYNNSSISIALFSKGKGIFGAIYNPYLDELFTAERGKGAYLNGEKITVSSKNFNESIVVFGTAPYYKSELGEKTFTALKTLFLNCNDIRRSGSAALDFCSIASGRTDVFFECRLSPWDFAAGSVIVEEAGGKITDMDGNELCFSKPCSILATNKDSHEKALHTLKTCL